MVQELLIGGEKHEERDDDFDTCHITPVNLFW